MGRQWIRVAGMVLGVTACATVGARTAAAQDDPDATHPRFAFEFAGGTAAAAPAGEAHAGVGSYYEDLWGSGRMDWVNARVHFSLVKRPRLLMSIGPVLQFDRCAFPGGADTDATGTVLRPDDLTVTRLLVGAQLRLRFGRPEGAAGFFFGPQLMIGWARSDAVRATASTPGFGTVSGLFYSRTDSFAFDLSVRFGPTFNVGRHAEVGLMGILGFAVQGAPKNGDATFTAADASDLLTGYAGIALTIVLKVPGAGAAAEPRAHRRGAWR